MSGAFSEGEYSCPQSVVDSIQGVSMDDALAIRLGEDVIARRYTDEIKAEVDGMISNLSAKEKSMLISLTVRFPAVSLLNLYEMLITWRDGDESDKNIPEEEL